MSVSVHTFGCRLNSAESQTIKNLAENAQVKNTIVFNTCAVTSEAERQARQAIRRARRENPLAKIIVTGCAAQISPEKYAAMAEVDSVLGNVEKLQQASYEDVAAVKVNDIMSITETAAHLVTEFQGHARAFVEIQQGCDHRCTFCIIPFGRGNSRSVPLQQVIAQIQLLVENGYNEVVLTGVDITSYKTAEATTLGALCQVILREVPDLPRLRLSSVDVEEIDADILALLEKNNRFMPHLHLSLQAGDDLILKRMKRRHSRAQAIEFCKTARTLRPDIVFGADFITGFPTETEEMFQNTLRLVEECGLTYLHVFPYSEREGTPAAKMPSVAKPLRKERAARLRKLGKQRENVFFNNNIHKNVEVIVEQGNIGRSEHFIPVHLTTEFPQGSVQVVTIKGYAAGRVFA
jgi:threonylcarbamoyladenosine tRNA methylthiotransferase MtaB